MIPLDATNTISVTEEFVSEFQQHQQTYEAQYCFQSLDKVLMRLRGRSNGHGNTASPKLKSPFSFTIVKKKKTQLLFGTEISPKKSPNFSWCSFITQSYYMWDSFAAGVALSSMRNGEVDGENEFSELEYMNITVITSNKPYGKRDGSNPFFDGRATPKLGLKEGGVHSGHVQTGIRDSFCLVPGSNRGRCEVMCMCY